jgi:hypothetical protein
MQPCLRDGPIALDGCGRDSKGLRRLVDVETRKTFQLDDAAEALVEGMQFGERLVQRKEVEGARVPPLDEFEVSLVCDGAGLFVDRVRAEVRQVRGGLGPSKFG